MADRILEMAAWRLGRSFQAAAVHVVEPAVVYAAEPAVLESPIAEVGGSVRAVEIQQADATLLVAEHDQVLAEQAQRDRRPTGRKLLAQRRGLPVTAQEAATGRARAGLGQQLVLFLAQHS